MVGFFNQHAKKKIKSLDHLEFTPAEFKDIVKIRDLLKLILEFSTTRELGNVARTNRDFYQVAGRINLSANYLKEYAFAWTKTTVPGNPFIRINKYFNLSKISMIENIYYPIHKLKANKDAISRANNEYTNNILTHLTPVIANLLLSFLCLALTTSEVDDYFAMSTALNYFLSIAEFYFRYNMQKDHINNQLESIKLNIEQEFSDYPEFNIFIKKLISCRDSWPKHFSNRFDSILMQENENEAQAMPRLPF